MNQLQPQASRQSKTLASFPFNWPVTSNVRLCSRRYFGKKECYRSSVGSTHFTDEETEAQREETPYPTKVTVQSNGLESSPRLLGWISLLPLESIPVLIKADFPSLPSSPTPTPSPHGHPTPRGRFLPRQFICIQFAWVAVWGEPPGCPAMLTTLICLLQFDLTPLNLHLLRMSTSVSNGLEGVPWPRASRRKTGTFIIQCP